MPSSTIASVPIKDNAAKYAAASYNRSNQRRISHLPIGVDDRLPVRAGLLDPFGGHRLADLLQFARERRRGRSDRHAVLGELFEVPLRLLLGQLPPTCFCLGRGF